MKKWLISRLLKQYLPVEKLVGSRTILVNLGLGLSYWLAWPELTETLVEFGLDEAKTGAAIGSFHTAVNIYLRYITTTAIFKTPYAKKKKK